MADIKYEIIEELGVLSESAKGWQKELNLISWNGAEPKYDLRDWAPNHEKMGKGVTLNEEEVKTLYKILGKIAEQQFEILRGGDLLHMYDVRVDFDEFYQEFGIKVTNPVYRNGEHPKVCVNLQTDVR